MTKDEHMSLISEESSSYPDNDPGLELALSLGGGGGINKLGLRSEQTRRILTSSSKDLQSQSSLSSSSSSSSSYLTKAADFSLSPNAAACNQVVGWPPIRAYRMNSMVNQVKFPSNDESEASVEKCKNKNGDIDINCSEGDKNYIVKEELQIKKSNFVKVNKDGNGIGRKVDLNAFNCYETLAQTVEKMFFGTGATSRSSRLLDGSSDFVLTYEDKDGDWMLVGDVPWAMFINSVKRLRIMRTAEANGLGSKFQISNVRPNLPI